MNINADVSYNNEPVRDNTERQVIEGSCYICFAVSHKKRRKTRTLYHNCNNPVYDKRSMRFSGVMFALFYKM